MPSDKKGKRLKKKYNSFLNARRNTSEPEPEPENSIEGINTSLKEFKDSQEVEFVIERVPPRDKEDRSENTE